MKNIKKMFRPGTKVRLIKMDDLQAPPAGTVGIVEFVDDADQIHVKWSTGSSLALIDKIDEFTIVEDN